MLDVNLSTTSTTTVAAALLQSLQLLTQHSPYTSLPDGTDGSWHCLLYFGLWFFCHKSCYMAQAGLKFNM
jgi:hypothetical protein